MSEADVVSVVTTTAPISSAEQPNSGNPITSQTTEVSVGSKRLHVTNLPFRIRDSDLNEMFGVKSES